MKPAYEQGRAFCAMTSRFFLPFLLAQYRSLLRHAGPFRFFCLGLDDDAVSRVKSMDMKGITLVTLSMLESEFPELKAARGNRAATEYFFTVKSAFCLHILRTYPEVDLLFYLDSDILCFGDPEPLAEELGNHHFLLFPHHFEGPDLKANTRGVYCAGAWAVRNTEEAGKMLDWWLRKCLIWCHFRFEDGKYGDQLYLDEMTETFDGVVVSRLAHGHVGPWNLQLSNRLRHCRGRFLFGESPLVFFHFHGARQVRPALIDCGVTHSHVRWNRALKQLYLCGASSLFRASVQLGQKLRTWVLPSAKDRGLAIRDYILTRRCYLWLGWFAVPVFLYPLWRVLLLGRQRACRLAARCRGSV